MALTGTAPIKRAIVRRARSSEPLVTALVGGLHQKLGPRKVRYPYLVYTEISAPFVTDWGTADDGGSREIRALYDIAIYASNSVEAENLDELVDALFGGADADSELDQLIDGQKVILCKRVATIPDGGPDRDDAGGYYARVGGTYEIWSVQPLPLPGP